MTNYGWRFFSAIGGVANFTMYDIHHQWYSLMAGVLCCFWFHHLCSEREAK